MYNRCKIKSTWEIYNNIYEKRSDERAIKDNTGVKYIKYKYKLIFQINFFFNRKPKHALFGVDHC